MYASLSSSLLNVFSRHAIHLGGTRLPTSMVWPYNQSEHLEPSFLLPTRLSLLRRKHFAFGSRRNTGGSFSSTQRLVDGSLPKPLAHRSNYSTCQSLPPPSTSNGVHLKARSRSSTPEGHNNLARNVSIIWFFGQSWCTHHALNAY